MNRTRLLHRVALATPLLLVVCWGLQAFGVVDDARPIGRWLLPPALVACSTLVFRWARHLRGAGPERRRRVLAQAALVALALVVRLLGADHEVGERAYLDEGTYVHHATEINEGMPWRWSFVYGHLSYYVGAFGLWCADLLPGATATVATAWSGTGEPLAHTWLILRCMVALLSALTVIPVAAIARAIVRGGDSDADDGDERGSAAATAGVLAGLLYIASPVFNGGSHLIISDYPSACLATFCLWFVARFGFAPEPDRARLGDFALAGLFAGLAAATKYPAGTVAVAIVVGWAARRLERRRIAVADVAALGLATASAMLAFAASMPTFLRDPVHAVTAPRGMLFGLRQYAGGGWIGVMPDDMAAWYARLAAEALGWAGLAAVLAGPLALRGALRRRWLVTAFYPFAYVGLLLTMSMVVERNLAPAIPVACSLAGVTVSVIVGRLRGAAGRASRPRTILAAALVAVVLLPPVWATFRQSVGLARDSTREQAARWMVANLPRGTRVFRESYTPRLPPSHFELRRARFAARVPIAEIEGDGYEYVLLARNAFGRFLDADLHRAEHHAVMARRYREMFERYREVRRFEPGPWRQGPTLLLLEVVPRQAPEAADLRGAGAVGDGAMASRADPP